MVLVMCSFGGLVQSTEAHQWKANQPKYSTVIKLCVNLFTFNYEPIAGNRENSHCVTHMTAETNVMPLIKSLATQIVHASTKHTRRMQYIHICYPIYILGHLTLTILCLHYFTHVQDWASSAIIVHLQKSYGFDGRYYKVRAPKIPRATHTTFKHWNTSRN